jgi:gas vesicle protein
VAQLSEIAGRQDPDWSAQVRARLDRAFELWQEPDSAETNMARILSHLKAETTRIKHALDEQAGAISCLAAADPQGAENKAAACRAHIRQLDQEIENTLAKIESLHGQIGESRRSRARLEFLQENIDRLALELGSDLRVAIKARLQELEAQFADTQELQAELDRLHRELNTWTERYNREENSHSAIAEQLQFKRSQGRSLQPREHTLASTIPAEAFQCPIASEIRCETDMRPYREMLAREIKSLERREVESKSALARTREDLRICGGRVRDVQDQIRRRLAANDRLRQETRVLQEQCAGEERAQARAQGMLAAYREEAAALRTKTMAPDGPEQPDLIGMRDCLESEKRGLIKRKHDAEEALAILLREQGRASAAAELARQRKGLEAELTHVRLLTRLLGPEGVQGEMAGRISRALGQEVNEMLRLIDTGLEFTLDLSGAKFLMGWNRDGRVIPFNTMNSAHFVLFIVPLLTALLNRMGRVRERAGLATLKVLCIEAESMSASNLIGLLKGLSLMKAKGFLDNALVAHYTSIRDPAKLHGFKEHILTAEGEASP